MRTKTLLIISALSLLFFLSTHSFASVKKVVPTKKPFKVTLTSMGGDYPSGIMSRKNQHPYNIPGEVLSRMMNNFDYKKRRVTGLEKKKRRVFHEKVANAAKYIRAAFLKAKPRQKVVFINYTPTGKTVCDIFIQNEKINWKFITIRGESRNKGMWIMVRGYLQKYYGTGGNLFSAQGLLGGGNYIDTGWIQMPLLRLMAVMKSENEVIKDDDGKKGIDDKKNKLEKLKRLAALYHKKLIAKMDFRNKAEELMREREGERLDIEEELEYLKLLKDEKIITRDVYIQRKEMVLEKF